MVLCEVIHVLKTSLYIILSLFIHVLLISGLIICDHSDIDQPNSREIIDLTYQNAQPPAAANLVNKLQPVVKKSLISSTDNKKHIKQSTDQTAIATKSQINENSPSDGNGESLTPASWGSVTRFPKVVKEFKPVYPNEAKAAGVAGAVILNVLVDAKGKVREVQVVSGPGFGLNESAVEALKQFEFLPAQVGSDSVPVKIRYTYRFKLEIN